MFRAKAVASILILVASTVLTVLPTAPAYAATISVSGHITSNTTWTAGNVYVVQDNITVDSGVMLTVSPGVIVKFAADKLLGVNGVLQVLGTAGNPAVFTSLKDDTVGGDTNGDGDATAPVLGDWGHIAFFDTSVDASNLIDHAIIRYGGYFNNGGNSYYNCWGCEYFGPVRFESASPTVRNTTITLNRGYAFSANIDSFPVLTANSLVSNVGNGLEVRGGAFSVGPPTVRHWSITDTAYALTGFTTVPSGFTLVIDPGVVVKFSSNNLLGVNGVLRAMGTVDNPVIFTSLKDDTVGGDTNGDGDATAPVLGDWGHIAFFDTSVDASNLIDHAIIRYGGYFNNGGNSYYNCWGCVYFGPVRFESASPTVRNTTITLNRGYAFSANIDSFPVLISNTLTTNNGNGLEVRGGTFSTILPVVRYWNITDTAYALTGFTTVPSGVTLVISPGVTIKFSSNNLLGVNGVLKVQGTISNPVIFTSLKDDTVGGDTNGDGDATAPVLGDWGHIAFFDTSVDASNLIDHAIIRYGGYFNNGGNSYYNCWGCEYFGPVRFESASPTVRNTTITLNRGYAFSANIDSFPVLTANSLVSNVGDGLEVRGGTFSTILPTVRYWSVTDTAYALTGYTTIPSGVTLVISPGVTIKFSSNNLLGVNGVLRTMGTADRPVTFTSLKDDTVGGDTNGDGDATAPALGDWGHIAFFDTSVDASNLIDHAIIRYGGYFNNGGNSYYNCWGCVYYGVIRFDAASPTMRNTMVALNRSGVVARNASLPVLQNNWIFGNQDYGLQNEDAAVTVDARYTWWGDASGPYHPLTNPAGKGNQVSDYVNYVPWVGSPPATSAWIWPGRGGAVLSPDGSTLVAFPPNAVTEMTLVTYTVQSASNPVALSERPDGLPPGLADVGHAFGMRAQTAGGAFASPTGQVTVRYTLSDVVNILNVNTLALYHWTGVAWGSIGSSLNPVNRTIVATITAAGSYAVLGQGKQFAYIPLVTR